MQIIPMTTLITRMINLVRTEPIKHSSIRETTRPPSNGRQGSKFISNMPALATKMSLPVSWVRSPWRVNLNERMHRQSVMHGPANNISSRLTSESRLSSSSRMTAPRGVISIDAGHSPSAHDTTPCALSCRKTDVIATRNNAVFPQKAMYAANKSVAGWNRNCVLPMVHRRIFIR